MEDFSFGIEDYPKDAVLDDDVTVAKLYLWLEMGILRFFSKKSLKVSTTTENINKVDEHTEMIEPEDANNVI